MERKKRRVSGFANSKQWDSKVNTTFPCPESLFGLCFAFFSSPPPRENLHNHCVCVREPTTAAVSATRGPSLPPSPLERYLTTLSKGLLRRPIFCFFSLRGMRSYLPEERCFPNSSKGYTSRECEGGILWLSKRENDK